MRLCLSCGTGLGVETWRCVECGWQPGRAGDVVLFAPHISGESEGYDPAWYDKLVELEVKNFWFVSRNRLIQWLARRHLPARGTYMEVGCGTGFVLQMLHRTFPDWRIFATEAQPEGIQFARGRVPSGTFYQMDACAIPFREEFDVIGAFDVIEHIKDDVGAIGQIHQALKPNGFFIVSVPQHMFLWSRYDEVAHHFRRYRVSELHDKLRAAGFVIQSSTSFNSVLFPLMLLSRWLMNRSQPANFDVLGEMRISRASNTLMSAALRVEYWLLRLGVRFPFGGSRIVVAQKV